MFKNPRILMISPPIANHILEDIAMDGKSLISLGLVYLAAALLEAEIVAKSDIQIINCNAEKIGRKSLKKLILDRKPGIVCTSANHTASIHEIGNLANLVKMVDKSIIVLVGGVHASALPEETLEDYPFDYVVIGEGERTIVELVKELKRERPNLRGVKGIAFREGNKIIRNQTRELIKNLDDLPQLEEAYSLINWEKHSPFVLVQASRGCTNSCTFCIRWKHTGKVEKRSGKEQIVPCYRQRSVESVIKEIELLYYKYGKRTFYFADDCFNINTKWLEDFCDKIIEKNLKIGIVACMRTDLIVRDGERSIRKLRKAGLLHVLCGVERAIDSDLDKLNKRNRIENSVKALKMFRDNNIATTALMIVGFEDETSKSLEKLIRFVKNELKPTIANYAVLAPLPGTAIWDTYKDKITREYYPYFNLSLLSPAIKLHNMTENEFYKQLEKMAGSSFDFKHIFGLLSSNSQIRKLHKIHYIYGFKALPILLKAYIKNGFKRDYKYVREYFYLYAKPPNWYDR